MHIQGHGCNPLRDLGITAWRPAERVCDRLRLRPAAHVYEHGVTDGRMDGRTRKIACGRLGSLANTQTSGDKEGHTDARADGLTGKEG